MNNTMHNNTHHKTYILENLGCANCAAKMERKINDLPQVKTASITFATKQLKVETEDPCSLKDELQHICSSIESEVYLVDKDAVHTASDQKDCCSKAKNSFLSGHKTDIATLLAGAFLFAAGIILEHIWGYDIMFAGGGRIAALKLAVFIAAYLLLGFKVLRTAAGNITRGQIFDENFLMSIATIAAFCIGEFAEGAGVMLFYRIGELFENMAVERSRSQIMAAVDMRPETVLLIDHADCGCEHEHHDHHASPHVIPSSEAKPGDLLLVRPGDRIPLDGIIVEGESRIDTSPITGEAVPVSAYPGAEVISGCINTHGTLKIRVIKPLSESMVTRILDSVENAAAGKPKIDKFITRFARIYTPIVVSLAVLTAIVPSLITGSWAMWIKTAITFLVISCPCALVISVPLAFFSGIGAASKLGILFKGGLAIEALKSIKGIIMDKTGTITKGVFQVKDLSSFGDFTDEELLALAAACEASSSHPIAASITEAGTSLHTHHCDCGCHHEYNITHIDEMAGLGIIARLDEKTVLCGNRNLIGKHNIIIPDMPVNSGTEVLVALDNTLIGRIIISDQLKEDSIDAVSNIKNLGLIPAILTGDNPKSANEIADILKISKVHAGLLPEEKLAALKNLRNDLGPVMFVGDGINDAPVLAGADVGAAMGSGADAAIEAADVVFMTSSLNAVPQAVSIARYTGRIAMQNIVFALAVKLLVILLGFLGFANIWAAVFADTGVAMICIINSLRVLWRKYL